MRRYCRFRLGSLALVCCSFFSTILLRATVSMSAATTAPSNTHHPHVESVENPNAQVRLTLHQESLRRVPSCHYSFSQVEIMNLHASDPIRIESIQTTPEETLLVRHDPQEEQHNGAAPDNDAEEDIFASSRSSSSSSSWDQRSIPQQIHASRMPSNNDNSDKKNVGGFELGPGQAVVVPITYLPRYPCTTLGDANTAGNDLEDYYAQQAPYQIAFSSTFDPDDEQFSLAQPPPPKLTKFISGTARADWEQLVREMPPQERSNWLQQQQQQQQQQQHGDDNNNDPEHQRADRDSSSASGGDGTETNSVEWVFEVRTTVLVETTRGSVQLPVRASSRRQNTYGLPDVIYFDQEKSEGERASSSTDKREGKQSTSPHPSDPKDGSNSDNQNTKGVLWLDTDLAPAESSTDDSDDDREGRGEEDEISPNTSRDCYNLFMTNPGADTDLRVKEVLLTRPDRMSLQIQGQLRAPSSIISQWWNTPRRNTTSGSSSDDEPLQQQIGSLIMGPGEQRYVVTVCTTGSSWATTADSRDWLYGDNDVVDSPDEPPLTADSPQSAWETQEARAAARATRLASAAEHSLGFLHLRTESGKSFFVALERLQKQCQGDASKGNDNRNTSDDKARGLSPQASPSLSDPELKQQAYPPVYHHALYKVQDELTADLAAQAGKKPAMTAPASPLVASVLKSEPSRLDFSLLSSSSPTLVSYLGIRNPKEYPIKIMRSGVAVEIEDELDSSQPNPEDLGLHMSVKIKNSYLDASALTEEALMITCSINWDKFQAHNLESLFFHGNVILRATSHVEYNYHQWIKNLVNTNSKKQQNKILITNDYADEPAKPEASKQTEFVLEIPLSVSIVQGKIGIMIHRTSHPFPHLWAVKSWKEGLGSVSGIFYPQRAFDIRAELESGEGPITEPIFGRLGIDHKLRIFANIHMPSRVDVGEEYQPQPLRLASAIIAHDQESGNATFSGASNHYDICGRFNIETGPPPEGDFPFKGFNDVGMVHIKYQFPDQEDSDLEDEFDDDVEKESLQAYPTYCYLSFTTEPFTERHQIPLIVYPGQSEIAGTQSPLQTTYTMRENPVEKSKKKRKSEGRMPGASLEAEESKETAPHALVGLDELVRWFKTSRVGSSLRDLLQNANGDSWGWSKRDYQKDVKLLEEYIKSLCHKSFNLKAAQLRPILLKVGAVRHGTVETSSFYMTNHNPIPLLVSVDVGEVEGMSISLARVPTRGQGDGHNILDHFPKKRQNALGGAYKHLVPRGEFQGHPLEGLRKFLRTTDIAQQFLSVFRFRDAISLSHTASNRQPLLNTLYKKYAFGEFHRDPLPIRFGEDGWSKCRRRRSAPKSAKLFVDPSYEFNLTSSGEEDDDEFTMEEHNARAKSSGKGPLLVSEDSKITRELKVCWNKDAEPMEYPSDGTYTIIPPGAIARFDLKLHAPPRSMLRDDITRFLSTGLVLSTDHGEILPVFVTFEALLGELQVSTAKQSAADNSTTSALKKAQDTVKGNNSVIEVPANLFHASQYVTKGEAIEAEYSQEEYNQHVDHTVPLRVRSSFSRAVRLVGISSCNPWFEVSIDDANGPIPILPSSPGATSGQGVDIGTVRSTINCKARRNSIASLDDYPSFFHCALNWLASRAELQPRGCGGAQAVQRRINSKDDTTLIHVAEHGGIKRALKAFEKALLVSSFAFGSGSDARRAEELGRMRHTGDGIVAPIVLDVFAEAWDAWRVVGDYGLHMLTSTLMAAIEYDSLVITSKKIPKAQNVSVSMRDTSMATILSAPKLFDAVRAKNMRNIADAATGDDEIPSTVEFHPTLVADASSLTLPLRNPTSVPVRVRLAIAPNTGMNDPTIAIAEQNPWKTKFGVEDEVRDSFTGYHASPFVQSGKLNITTQHYHAGVAAEQLWWNGAGGYFLADNNGDLVRSHHNIRIMAGGGAQVSLVNPSLHSNVALLVGCGVRCGVRDDNKHLPQMQDGNESSTLTSPIGAAAAVGITLSGRTRSSLPQANVRSMDEPLFLAGAATPGRKGGPAAFALPYSALGDIIIPPFGEVEVGPILFRPPGRYSVHGCQSSSDSRALHMSGNEDKAKACSSNVYQSMVYLENSLTGLERISLHGRAMWEKIVFLDPPPPPDVRYADDFGDVELRHGRSTLVFSGSKATKNSSPKQRPSFESTVPGSVIKEVLVYNAGDTVVDVGGVYLSDSAMLHAKPPISRINRKEADVCSFKQFRLLNCLDEESDYENDRGLQNVRHGFTLQPGKNISLFVEHFPDCSLQREFVALNLERRLRGKSPGKFVGSSGKVGLLSQSGADSSLPNGKTSSAFRQRKLNLLVGFEMTDGEFKSCAPIRRWGFSMSDIHREARCASKKNCRGSWFARFNYRLFLLGGSALGFILTSAAMAATYTMTYKGYMFRRQSSDFFSSALVPRRKAIDNGSTDKALNQQSTGIGNWSAAFRCLARADPSSADLQTLGREQIRHAVLGRYKSMGILSPQCFNSNGVFHRERSGANISGSPSRQIPGKEGSAGGSDRVRTLSDAIYRHCSTHQDIHLQQSLPCGLSWRVAVARGVALPRLSANTAVHLHTSELLLQRVARTNVEVHAPDERSIQSENQQSDEISGSSEQTDENSSEAQFTEDDTSLFQDSFVSELSEENVPETPDDASEEIATVSSEAKTEEGEGSKKKNQTIIPADPGAKRTELQTITSSHPEEEAPRDDSGGEKKNVINNAKGKIAESNSTAKSTIESPICDNVAAKTGKKESANAGQSQKKKDKPQELKNDKRGRQKTRGKSPVKSEVTQDVAGRKQLRSTERREPQSKTNEAANSSRSAKGKAAQEKNKSAPEKGKASTDKVKAAVDQGRQTGGKGREKKNNTNSSDSKGGRGPDVEEKTSKRKGNKGDASGIAKRNSKDNKTNANEKKSKSSRRKEKKARSDKDTASEPNKDVGQDTQAVSEPTEPVPAPVLRPPPGLAPPPGFGGQESSGLARPSLVAPLLTPAAFLSDTSILGSQSSTVLGTPSRSGGESAFGGLSPSILNATNDPPSTPVRGIGSLPPSSHDPTGEALLASVTSTPISRGMDTTYQPQHNSTEGFDVMDFLDSILNDGSGPPHEPSPQAPLEPNPFLTSKATAVPHLSLDPWATERQSSRASTYGISINDAVAAAAISGVASPPTLDALSKGGGDEAAVTSIPLVSSAAVLYANDRTHDDDDDDDEEDNGDSFYASLLGKPAVDDDDDR